MAAIAPPSRNVYLANLLHATAAGNRDAFHSLYQETAPQLFALLLRILHRRDLAEDVLQDAFVNVWRKAASFDASQGAVFTWLTRIVRNRAIDSIRREKRMLPVDNVEAMADAAQPPEPAQESPLSAAESRQLAECLDRLSGSQKQSVTLAYFQGSTHEEIASHLQSPLGTVKSWIRRGLTRLKECLEI
ncbi:MAG TPA: sigma-70 family RNA polymerase sigma factor [Gammaproteobacteria bacterium]|nr:sigma-70 family RNA polymerase sigma factor [Gammaproteobacteria bacterium]